MISTLVLLSWICVGILTAINIFVFLKLKQASEMMMKSIFPGAKDMNEAASKMQDMMKLFPAGMGGPSMNGGNPFGGGFSEDRLKTAMDMLQKLQKQQKR